MRILILSVLLVSLGQVAHAQTVLCGEDDSRCRSQLMRLDVTNEALNQTLASTQRLEDLALPAIDTFLQSDAFAESFITDYPMESMGFPFNAERCLSEQSQGDPNFLGLDCANPLLCSDASVSEAAKKEVCLNVPCSLLMGNQMNQCPPNGEARPTQVHFPQPVGVRKLAMSPTSISAEGTTLKICFAITQMEITTAVEMEFQRIPQLTYKNLGMRDLKVNLDGPRQICMSATVDMNAANPVSGIKIENIGGDFVSNVMVDRALAQAQVYGLDGYSATTVGILQTTALPPIVRHMRPTVEAAVRESLSEVFEEQIGVLINSLKRGSAPTTVATPSDSFVSELGVGNLSVSKYVDLMDCAVKKQNGTPIPAEHKCFNQIYPFENDNLRLQDIPKPAKAAQYLREQMNIYEHVTSERLRQQILGFEATMTTPALAELYRTQLKPLADMIPANQLRSNLLNNVELMTNLGGRLNSSFGVSLPEICDLNNPSAHANRSIPNCPVQAYVDLDEMNRLLTSMYETGRLCHRGRGDYVPQLTSNGQQRYADNGAPLGDGCKFLVEGEENGMSCYLNGAPQLRFDPATQGYKLQMNTKACFRDAVFLGQGKIGGDINFDIAFSPSVCDGTDFCLENGNAQWNVVEGTARYALRESSWFNGLVRDTIDDKLNELLGQTIRLPLFSNDGPMSMIPMEADGRVDKGSGYFGACFKLKD
jgi:hypothetical protein